MGDEQLLYARKVLQEALLSICHRGDWSQGSSDRNPLGYGVVAFIKTNHNCSFVTTKISILLSDN
jgi:hypothetical protein